VIIPIWLASTNKTTITTTTGNLLNYRKYINNLPTVSMEYELKDEILFL
jgi:hypothetical protein